MDALYGTVMQIVTLSVLNCIFEYSLPKGPLQKSATRAIGIILLLLAAEPILSLIKPG